MRMPLAVWEGVGGAMSSSSGRRGLLGRRVPAGGPATEAVDPDPCRLTSDGCETSANSLFREVAREVLCDEREDIASASGCTAPSGSALNSLSSSDEEARCLGVTTRHRSTQWDGIGVGASATGADASSADAQHPMRSRNHYRTSGSNGVKRTMMVDTENDQRLRTLAYTRGLVSKGVAGPSAPVSKRKKHPKVRPVRAHRISSRCTI
jgi:hypothetical protein